MMKTYEILSEQSTKTLALMASIADDMQNPSTEEDVLTAEKMVICELEYWKIMRDQIDTVIMACECGALLVRNAKQMVKAPREGA